MLANANLISCNFRALTLLTHVALKNQNSRTSLQPQTTQLRVLPDRLAMASGSLDVKTKSPLDAFQRKGRLQICHSSLNQQQNLKEESEAGGDGTGNGNGGQGRDWTTSILLFLLWAALMYYVYFLTPNQTPVFLVKP